MEYPVDMTGGWGFQGDCWNCGEIGHKQWECPWAVNGVEGGEGEPQVKEEAAVEIGRISNLGAIEVPFRFHLDFM